MISTATVFASEVAGTAVLMAIGVGTSANTTLKRAKGFGGGYVMGALGWAFGVFAGVFVAHASGAHLNPAVTIARIVSGASEFAPGVPVNAANTFAYLGGEVIGALLGSLIAWLAYRAHFAASGPDAGVHGDPTVRDLTARDRLAIFATVPEIRSWPQNATTEIIATFVLVFTVLRMDDVTTGLGPLGVALVVLAIGLGLGGPTGWSINPARDFSARLAHQILPIPGKGGSQWSYGIVATAAPMAGGIIAALVFNALA